MGTLKVTKGNVNQLVRRGVISGNVAKIVNAGGSVSIEFQGNLFSSFRPQSITVDGKTSAFGRGFEPERKRRADIEVIRKPKPVIEGASGFPILPQREDPSGLSGGLPDAIEPRGLEARTGITARDIFGVARQKGQFTEEIIGSGPVFIKGKEKDIVTLSGTGQLIGSKQIDLLLGGGRGAGFGITEQVFERRRSEQAVKKALALPPGAFLKEMGRGVTQATLGFAQSTIKGVGKLTSAINIGQFVEREGKLVFARPTREEFISGRIIQTQKQAGKLFDDFAVKGSKLADKDIQNAVIAGSLALGAVTLPSIVMQGVGVGISGLGVKQAVSEAKRGSISGATGGLTIALLGATEAPGLARRLSLEALVQTKLVKVIPKEKVFDVGSLKDKTQFPMTQSIRNTLKEFNKAKGGVSHATDRAINLVKEGIGAGKRQSQAAEGLFVTPRGKGSVHFTRAKEAADAKIEFKLIPEISRPKSIQIQTKGITRIPKEIFKQGKIKTIEFIRELGQKQTGKTVISPGSEARFNKQIKKQLDITTTGELESLIPFGQKIKALEKTRLGRILGFEKVTRVGTEIVTLPEQAVVTKGGKVLTKVNIKEFSSRGRVLTKQVTPSRILAPTRRLPTATRALRSVRQPRVFRTLRRIVAAPRSTPRPRATERPGRPPIRTPRIPRTPRITTTTRTGRVPVTPRPARIPTRPRTLFTTTKVPLPPPVKLKLGLTEKEKKKDKRLARVFKFQPSVEAVEFKIKGVSPKVLTGITTRKIKM